MKRKTSAHFKIAKIYHPYEIDEEQDMYVAVIDFIPDLFYGDRDDNYRHEGKIEVRDRTLKGCEFIAYDIVQHLNEMIGWDGTCDAH